MSKEKERIKEKCADEFLKLFTKYTNLLSPEEVVGLLECFKYIYINRYADISLQKLKQAKE
jgi:hypothetical protein